MKMRVLHRYPTQKKLGLYNVPVSRVDETASKLAIAFKHDKGLMADICNSSLVHIRDRYLNSTRISGIEDIPILTC